MPRRISSVFLLIYPKMLPLALLKLRLFSPDTLPESGSGNHNSFMMTTIGLEAFADTKRLIVVAAHPDDLETQVAGTLIQLIARGVTVFSVNATLGNIGSHDPAFTRHTLAVTRIEETKVAAQILGLAGTFTLGRDDGELVPDLALRADIARLYRITQADTMLTFDPYATTQIHPDHRAIGQAAIDAFMPSKMPLYRPEQLVESDGELGCVERVFLFGTQRSPDVLVDISDVIDKKMASCVAHKSQFPRGEADLQWFKRNDAKRAEGQSFAYGESFKQLAVW